MCALPASRTALLAGLMLLLPGVVQAQKRKPDPCLDTSSATQATLNECARQKRDRAQARMQKLLTRLKAESTPAQKAWEAYRDAQLSDLYPVETRGEEGSIFPLCLLTLETKLIEGRIRDLQALTIKTEGEGCAGFVLQSQAGRNSRILTSQSRLLSANGSLCNGSKQEQVSKTTP